MATSTRSHLARSLRAFGALLALAPVAIAVSASATAEGCGGGSSYCDTANCYACDGYGCHAVAAPPLTACTRFDDPACVAPAICTNVGCADPCASGSTCASGLACIDGYCVPPGTGVVDPLLCAAASDCGANEACVDGACVAIPPCTADGCTCKYSSECGAGRLCVDSACADACSATVPCPGGLVCDPRGFCAAAPSPACTATSAGNGCDAGRKCAAVPTDSAACELPCAADGDCKVANGTTADPTQRCIGGACVPDTRPHPECTGDSDCLAGKQVCVDGFCRYDCTTDAQCLAIDSRIGVCATGVNYCESATEANAKCTSKSDCSGALDCVDNSCE